MLWLYRILFLPALLVLAPRYLWRMRRRGGYGENFSQRFGLGHALPPKTSARHRIWLQAVSVGEVLAVGPLLEQLRQDHDVEIYLTTTTSTGYRLANERYRSLVVGIGYFPIDAWMFSRLAWRAIAPDLVILMEGERWPEHVHQAQRRGVPVLSINARLSDRSYRRLRKFGFVRRAVFGGVTRLLASSTQDAARFRELGFPADRIATTGNLKLDVSIDPLSDAERAQLRRELGLRNGSVILGSSTWPGEERAMLEAWQDARAAGFPCSLLIVPRHAERRDEIEAWLQTCGVSFHFRSRGAAPGEVDVAIADTTGELRKLTQLAEMVFVGKSLPPNEGGQTPVEAAALEKPLLFGPRMSNFRAIADELLKRGAAQEVKDDAVLVHEITNLLRDPNRRVRMATAAAQWHRENAGAVKRTAAVIREVLDGSALNGGGVSSPRENA
jgi:3-deoxy-D-manno-octulosonic-acid transferase